MSLLRAVLSHGVSAGYVALAVLAIAQWSRRKDRTRSWIAAATALLGVTAVSADLAATQPWARAELRGVAVLAFLASGWAVLQLRHSLRPMWRTTRVALLCTLMEIAAFDLAVSLPSTGAAATLRLDVAVALTIGAWMLCIADATFRLWQGSVGRPTAQRARLRAFSAGWTLLLVVAALVAVARIAGPHGDPAVLGAESTALLGVPLLWFGISPPRWLRSVINANAERDLQRATDSLLVLSPDRFSQARRGLARALQLVGGAGGAVIGGDGILLAIIGISANRGEGRVISMPIPVSAGSMTLLITVPPYAQLFGDSEAERLERYAAALALAFDNVRRLDEITVRESQYEAVLHAIDARGDGLLIADEGRPVYANDAYCAMSATTMGEMSVETSVHHIGGPHGTMSVTWLRKVTEEQRPDERIRSLRDATTRFLADLTASDLAWRPLLQAIGAALDRHIAEVWLVDATQGLLTLRESWHDDGIRSSLFEQAGQRIALHRGVDIAGCVWNSRQPLTVADIGEDSSCTRRDLARVLGVHGAAAIPIVADDAVMGVIMLFSRRVGALDDAVMQSLAQVGREIGAVLDQWGQERPVAEDTERLEEMASSTDAVTGLANRRGFEQALATLPVVPFTLLTLEVVDLEPHEDNHGGEVPNLVLHTLGGTLASVVRDHDVVARVGSLEFAVLLPGAQAEQAAEIAERLRFAMSSLSVAHGRARLNIGWSSAPAGADVHDVWRACDELRSRASTSGRDGAEGREFVARPVSGHVAAVDVQLVSAALGGEPMGVVYQPLVDLDTGAIIAYEAFARPPGHAATSSVETLFAAARRVGRIRDLDLLCRRSAVRAARLLPGAPLLFLNVSVRALLDAAHPVDQLLLLLRWAGWTPERTVLEVRAREAAADVAAVRLMIAAYREHEVKFALDDVGAGLLSRELLLATNPEFIKIAVDPDGGRPNAIRSAQTFATKGRAQLIATGVETAEIADAMRALGVPFGQGFALGRPATLEELSRPHTPPARRWRTGRGESD